MNDILYISLFKDYIRNYLTLKRAIGYKFNAEAENLKLFDRFVLEKYPKAHALTKEIAFAWCSKRTYEKRANQRSRISILREFGKYLNSIDIEAYIIPKRYFPTEKKYIPHIYTICELKKLFSQIDKCKILSTRPYRHQIIPLIFRMLYMCGLRASEARLLRVGDVDLKDGILTIRQSKNNNSRLVPMSNSLTKYCQNFSKKVHSCSISEDYYFPFKDGKPITLRNLYRNFRIFLWRAKIPHGGRGRGPRLHDLRHTYAVHCLKKWVEQEKDLTVYLPVLKSYMGHHSFSETAYYLHLTADVFPNIMFKIEKLYPEIIPRLEKAHNETY